MEIEFYTEPGRDVLLISEGEQFIKVGTNHRAFNGQGRRWLEGVAKGMQRLGVFSEDAFWKAVALAMGGDVGTD